MKRFAATTTWISTLRIHTGRDREHAVGNAARFHAAGGRILYGTDMGNGASSGGLEADELKLLTSFGIVGDALLEALTGPGLLPRWGATVVSRRGRAARIRRRARRLAVRRASVARF